MSTVLIFDGNEIAIWRKAEQMDHPIVPNVGDVVVVQDKRGDPIGKYKVKALQWSLTAGSRWDDPCLHLDEIHLEKAGQ